MYDYLTQARAKLFDWIEPLTPEQYFQEHPIGLASLARTLHHTKAAERSYMERIRGKTGPLDPQESKDNPEVSSADAMPFALLKSDWITQAAQTRADLAAVDDWDTPRVYTTTWEDRPYHYRASLGDIFSQIVTHEVHHRTQALQMLRRLDIKTDDIDYNALMWEQVDSP
jgi:uncharacterized damage-inducible protein DinB